MKVHQFFQYNVETLNNQLAQCNEQEAAQLLQMMEMAVKARTSNDKTHGHGKRP